MKSDVSLEIEIYFNGATRETIHCANGQQEFHLEGLALDQLSQEEKIAALKKELNLINYELSPQSRDYFNLLNEPEHLQRLFTGRIFLYSPNEIAHLREAFEKGERYKDVARLLAEAIALLSPTNLAHKAENKKKHVPLLQLYEQIIDQALQLGQLEGREIIAAFKKNNPLRGRVKKEYRSRLSVRVQKASMDFNALKDPQFFYLLNDLASLKDYFVDQYEQGANIDDCCKDLQNAVALNDLTGFLTSELLKFDENLMQKTLDRVKCHQNLSGILYCLVPSSALIDDYNALMRQSELQLALGKPALFIKEDIKMAFKKLLNRALADLKKLLDCQHASKKYHFIHYMLRELDFLKLISENQGKAYTPYYERLIYFYDIEWRYVQSLQIEEDFSIEEIFHGIALTENQPQEQPSTQTEQEKPAAELPALVFTIPEKYLPNLPSVLNCLIKIKALPPETTVAQFEAIMDGQEVQTPLRWLAPQGDLASFIKELIVLFGTDFSPYNQHWIITPKYFVKKGGEALDANKFRNSKATASEYKYIEAARKFKPHRPG